MPSPEIDELAVDDGGAAGFRVSILVANRLGFLGRKLEEGRKVYMGAGTRAISCESSRNRLGFGVRVRVEFVFVTGGMTGGARLSARATTRAGLGFAICCARVSC